MKTLETNITLVFNGLGGKKQALHSCDNECLSFSMTVSFLSVQEQASCQEQKPSGEPANVE